MARDTWKKNEKKLPLLTDTRGSWTRKHKDKTPWWSVPKSLYRRKKRYESRNLDQHDDWRERSVTKEVSSWLLTKKIETQLKSLNFKKVDVTAWKSVPRSSRLYTPETILHRHGAGFRRWVHTLPQTISLPDASLPEPESTVLASRCVQFTVRRKSDAVDGSKVTFERLHFFSRSVGAFVHFKIFAAANVKIFRRMQRSWVDGGGHLKGVDTVKRSVPKGDVSTKGDGDDRRILTQL